jgi:hypothetical protein
LIELSSFGSGPFGSVWAEAKATERETSTASRNASFTTHGLLLCAKCHPGLSLAGKEVEGSSVLQLNPRNPAEFLTFDLVVPYECGE